MLLLRTSDRKDNFVEYLFRPLEIIFFLFCKIFFFDLDKNTCIAALVVHRHT